MHANECSLEETDRRREIQVAHNLEHGITPETIVKSIQEIEFSTRVADARAVPAPRVAEGLASYQEEMNLEELAKVLEKEMEEAATQLDFEKAALLRDELFDVRAKL
jgi:excinuclease ABC subunit B